MRILSAEDVRRALPMREAIRATHDAMIAVARGEAVLPLRTHLPFGRGGNSALVMPAATSTPPRLGAKFLSLVPDNPARGRPFIHGVVIVFNPKTGRPEGLVEGTTLTAIRTGAASGFATQLLARHNARVVGVIGSGGQARTQLEAVCCVRHIQEVRVFSPNRRHAQRYAREMAQQGGIPDRIRIVASASDAAEGADIICTATPATRPVLGLGDISRGAHINAIGSFTPQMRELAPALIRRARVFVDSRKAAMEEAGELISAVKDGSLDWEDIIEIGEVAIKSIPGRENEDHITVFKSVGLAIQDLMTGELALRRAKKLGLGTVVEI